MVIDCSDFMSCSGLLESSRRACWKLDLEQELVYILQVLVEEKEYQAQSSSYNLPDGLIADWPDRKLHALAQGYPRQARLILDLSGCILH
jgi:hypothetical protein